MDITLAAADGHTFTAYLCGPEDARTGIVVLPEIFGINAHIRQMADRFAARGYRVICPSLFDRAAGSEPGLQLGYDPMGRDQGLALRKTISDEDALLDIEAAAAALGGQSARLVTGYCWGGYLSWRAACLSDTFAAASCWYGGGIVRHCHDTPRIPVQMHFGGQDGSIPMSDVQAIQAAQPGLPIHVYPEAGHAFGREGTTAYHPASAALAWERTLAFFADPRL
ncbi:dienelactone hydrolase family protein [Castellaniella sp.]|jgi:carboxymethylenebutenolidase|uniref:dienelactone hydrolase family protein n=1 Tax=Castellaniella sp. TaxID=1955812 RepID=UPI003C7690DC